MFNKKLVLLFICAALMLVGCGNNADDAVDMQQDNQQQMQNDTNNNDMNKDMPEGDHNAKPEDNGDAMKPENGMKDDGMKEDDMKKDEGMKEGMDKTMPEKNDTEGEKTSLNMPMPGTSET